MSRRGSQWAPFIGRGIVGGSFIHGRFIHCFLLHSEPTPTTSVGSFGLFASSNITASNRQIREDHAAELERCETELRHADIELQAERRRVDEYAASNAQLDADRQKRPRDGGGHPAVGGKRPMVGGKQPVGATASVNGEDSCDLSDSE